ncbi:MAG: C-terminal target protein [Bacteroidetes bacterium]|nr:C-terminal target protein [Bacteroidota bacterium]
MSQPFIDHYKKSFMKTLTTLLFLIAAIAGFAQGHQNIINIIPAVTPGGIYGAKVISYVGDHRIAAFFARGKRNGVKAGVDLVVSDITGNILLTQGIAMDSAIEVLAAGGCRDGGYYVLVQHQDRSYTKFQNILIKLDSAGQIQWSRAAQYDYRSWTISSTVVEDESGNFYINQDGDMVCSLVSFQADGTYRWGTTFAYDNTSTTRIYSMCLTGDSGIMCIGQRTGDKTLTLVNYDGSIRSVKSFHTDSCDVTYTFIHKTFDGGYIAGGRYEFLNVNIPFFPFGSGLCKFDHSGNVEWESYFYDNGGCQAPTTLDAVQDWDGRYSVIGVSFGILNLVYGSAGDMQGYLKTPSSHSKGALYYVDQHIVKLDYSETYNGNLIQDTMKCSFFESDHVLYTCNTTNTFQCLNKSVTDSNHQIITGGYTLVPNKISAFSLWPITTVNVNYSGSGIVECNPPFTAHSGPSDVEDIQLSGFEVSPVPSSGKISITLFSGSTADGLKLFDISGKLLEQRSIRSEVTDLNLSTYSDGVYFIQIENSTSHIKAVKKVIVQR